MVTDAMSYAEAAGRRSLPSWSAGTLLLALLLTAGMFLLIPYLELLAKPPVRTRKLHTIEPARLPPPPPETKRIYEVRPDAASVPRPRLRRARPRLMPLRANLNLELVTGNVRGDFDLDFAVARPDLVDELGQMVFELEQVDEPPMPLVRLQPIYPTVARLRQLEGAVEVEFVVRADGTTADLVVLLSEPGEVFVKSAERAIRLWRFRPGTHRGEAVPVRVRQKVTFRLEGGR